MKFARRALAFAAIVAATLGATSAQAIIQRWTFQQVTFQDVRNTRTGELMHGGTLTGFFLFDTDRQRINSWNIFTSPGWTNCNDPARGYVCYTEGLHWTKGDSYVYEQAPFFQLVREERKTSALLNLFLRPMPGTLAFRTFDFTSSGEIVVGKSTTYRHIVSGYASLVDAQSH